MNTGLRRFTAIATLAAVTIFGPSLVRTDTVAGATAKLTDLRGVEELKTLFNQDTGKVRLVLLVSPT
jgi:hypothetical protein